MSAVIKLHQHLLDKFKNYSTKELLTIYNDTLINSSWGTSKSLFRTAVLNALSKRGLDLSQVIQQEDGFTRIYISPLRLEGNLLVAEEFLETH